MVRSVASAYRPCVLKLLVVPPEWGEQTARHAMRIAATPTNVKSAATILSESVDLLLAGLLWLGMTTAERMSRPDPRRHRRDSPQQASVTGTTAEACDWTGGLD